MTEALTMPSRKLVVFDVEGVLLPKNRYLVFEVGRNLRIPQFVKVLLFGLLYEVRLLSLESTLKKIFALFKDMNVNELLEIFRKVPLLPHTSALFAELRGKGLKTALISSGLPQIMVENLASRLKADYAYGLELETEEDVLTGKIRGEVIKKNGKALVMERLLQRENLRAEDCVVVADDRNNVSIFSPETLKIGYNPDFMIILRSDYVVHQNILEIVPILEEARKQPRYSVLRSEVIREVIHAGGFLTISAAMYLGTYTVAFLLSLIALIYVASELARIERINIPLFSSITLRAATYTERYEFVVTPVFLAFGITLSLLLFPTPVNYASIAIVTLGDSTASVFGKLFGKTPIPLNRGKNLEGSLAGFIFAFLGATFFLHPTQSFIGAVAGMLVESLPLPINDNLTIPLTTGALLTLLM